MPRAPYGLAQFIEAVSHRQLREHGLLPPRKLGATTYVLGEDADDLIILTTPDGLLQCQYVDIQKKVPEKVRAGEHVQDLRARRRSGLESRQGRPPGWGAPPAGWGDSRIQEVTA